MEGQKAFRTAISGLLAGATCASLLILTPLVASATTDGCNPNRSNSSGNWHDGWTNTQTSSIGGVYADIYNYQPVVSSWNGYSTPPGPPNSFAWTMLQVTGQANQYVQVGWVQTQSGRNTFEQYNNNGTPQTLLEGGTGSSLPTYEPIDTSTYYTVYDGNTAGKFTFAVNGTMSNNYFSNAALGGQLDQAFISSEVTDLGTQLGGDASSVVSMTDSSYYLSGWQAFDPTSGLPSSTAFVDEKGYFGYSYGSVSGQGGTINSWDWGCPNSEVAFQGSNNDLYTFQSSGNSNSDTTKGMKSGTSPSLALLPNGSYEIAFQANTGNLFTYNTGTGTATDTGQGMLSGTSPAITATSGGGWIIAFQANTGNLYTYDSNGTSSNKSQGMKSGTSPTIAYLTNSTWMIGFQANTGNLYTYSSGGTSTNRSLGMLSGTSPSITALSSGAYEIACQANTGVLWTFSSSTGSNTNQSQNMASGTSPSIATLSGGGWEIAYQSSGNNIYFRSSGGSNTTTSLGMVSSTSPSIRSTPNNNGWVAAYQSSDTTNCSGGNCLRVTATALGTSENSQQAMASGTGPGIS